MSTPVISGDGIFSHIFIGAADLQKSVAFYAAALGALGIKNLGPFNNGWVLFGRENEPPRILRRLFGVSHAAWADSINCR